MRRLLLLPEQASTFASTVDQLHYFVITVTMIASALVGLLAFAFFCKYRETTRQPVDPLQPDREVRGRGHQRAAGLLPPLVRIGFRDFVWSRAARERDGRLRQGKQWMWKFAYPEGPNAIGVAARSRQPAGAPADHLPRRIHSFFVPAFRIKLDALPGRYTETWFEATKPGRYQIFCAEYCGAWHSQMWGEVVVMAARVRRVARGAAGAVSVSASTGGADDGRQLPAASMAEYGQAGRRGAGLPSSATRSTAAAHRPDLGRPLPAQTKLARERRDSSPTRRT